MGCSIYYCNSGFVDNATVRKNSYNATVWVKYNRTNGDHILEQLLFIRESRTYKSLKRYVHDSNGDIIYTDEGDYNVSSIPPGSMLEAVYTVIW